MKLREFWLDIATPYGDPCDFVSEGTPHSHPSVTNIHVREVSPELDAAYIDCYRALNRIVNPGSNKMTLDKAVFIASEALATIKKARGE